MSRFILELQLVTVAAATHHKAVGAALAQELQLVAVAVARRRQRLAHHAAVVAQQRARVHAGRRRHHQRPQHGLQLPQLRHLPPINITECDIS